MQKLKFLRYGCGLIILPLLYARYSFLISIPLAFIIIGNPSCEKISIFWFLYAFMFYGIMGFVGLMNWWTKALQSLFKVRYQIGRDWASEGLYSFSIWQHPTIKVRGKEYQARIATSGGKSYEYETTIRRKAIFYWFFG